LQAEASEKLNSLTHAEHLSKKTDRPMHWMIRCSPSPEYAAGPVLSDAGLNIDQGSNMSQQVLIDGPVSWRDIARVAEGADISLSESRWEGIRESRAAVISMVNSGQRAYGVNTGLGDLCNHLLDADQLGQMSRGTILNHACGVGPLLEKRQVRAIMAAALVNFSQGYSGLSLGVVEALMAMLNRDLTPQVPSLGSVGYLSHMAHIALPLIGVGEVEFNGGVMPASEAMYLAAIQLPELGAKDGLSLVNGTPCMTGLACLVAGDAEQLMSWADIGGALSFEALGGQLAAFGEANLALKGSVEVAKVGYRLRSLLADSPWLASQQSQRTQDALSLRSMPQIHGACRQQWRHFCAALDGELSGVSDNPLIMKDEQGYRVVSQANPHGQGLALASDALAPALAELGSVAERRSYRLLYPQVSGLPGYLTDQGGISSGLMIAQYTSASLCADNRRLAQPVSVDNFVTSGLQEDHLSFGTSAALRLFPMLDNVRRVLAVELFCGAQALDFLDSDQQCFSPAGTAIWRQIRQRVPHYTCQRWIAPDIAQVETLLRDGRILSKIEQVAGLIN